MLIEVSRGTSAVQTTQRHAFPIPPVRPRKPWIAQHSWSIIRQTPLRRSPMRRWEQWSLVFTTNVWFLLWLPTTTRCLPTMLETQMSLALSLGHQAHLNRALCGWNIRFSHPGERQFALT